MSRLCHVHEKMEMTVLVDSPDGEFGRIHPVKRSWYLENAMTYEVIKGGFGSEQTAHNWAKRNGWKRVGWDTN